MNSMKNNIVLKSIFILVSVIIVIILILNGPKWYQNYSIKQFDGESYGTVISIVPKEITSQHYNGTNTKIVGYTIVYVYEINNIRYNNNFYVKSKPSNIRIIKQLKSTANIKVDIKYDIEDPEKSAIIFK